MVTLYRQKKNYFIEVNNKARDLLAVNVDREI